ARCRNAWMRRRNRRRWPTAPPWRSTRPVATGPGAAAEPLRRLGEIAQHEVQDAAVLEIFDLVERVDAAAEAELPPAVVLRGDGADDVHARLDPAGHALDVDRLATVKLQVGDGDFLQGQRENAHADEVGAVDALEALGHHGPDAEKSGALGRPVARGAGAVFLAGEDYERRA